MPILETIRGWFPKESPITEAVEPASARDAASWLIEHLGETTVDEDGTTLREAFTQADIELALDDRGWLVGGKRMMGELDPLSRQVQVNRSRYYWLRDPLAKQAVRLWTDYCFGDSAMSWTCEDTGVQKKLDKFMKDRRNRRYTSREGQRRMSQRLLVDGELFFAVFTNGEIRTYDCLHITDIITDKDDQDKVIAYKRVCAKSTKAGQQVNQTFYYKPWDLDDASTTIDTSSVANDGYNLVPVDPNGGKSIKYEANCVMYHLAFDAFDRRGNGLLSCCSDWSREHRRFMIARVAIMQALSKFAFKTTVKGGQNVVNTIRAKLESTFAQSGLSGGTQHQPVAAPGANWLQNEGINLESMPRTTGAGDGKTDADSLKLMVSAGTGVFLHYFGDPSTGNLATATAMELPMQKMFSAYQVYWKDAWRDLHSIVLEEGPDDEPAEILYSMPDILEDDLQKLAAFLTAITGVFPEAKVPALLKQCLESANVSDIDEVMQDIEENKAALDEQQKLDAATQQKNQLALVAAKKGTPAGNDPTQQGVPATPASVAEVGLIDAMKELAESLR